MSRTISRFERRDKEAGRADGTDRRWTDAAEVKEPDTARRGAERTVQPDLIDHGGQRGTECNTSQVWCCLLYAPLEHKKKEVSAFTPFWKC